MPAADPQSNAARGSNGTGNGRLKIYLLPNLMTAGNLFCGFLALTKIVEAEIDAQNFDAVIKTALFFILLACIFDLLDGRVARMGGYESPFGREFDSLADLVSFGVAPAFLVHRIVARDLVLGHPEVGWFIAALYLICGALRLARFNCLANLPGASGGKEFTGFPIPAAAGLVASVTLFIMWWEDREFARGYWRFVLPALMVFLSVMMVSDVKYPSFKSIDFRTRKPFAKLVVVVAFMGLVFVLRHKILPWVLPMIFTTYLIYGFVRPRISREVIHEIEDEDEEEDAAAGDGGL